jgi:hypothetical protein
MFQLLQGCVLSLKGQEKRQKERPRNGWVDNIKIVLGNWGWVDMAGNDVV